VKCSPKKKTGLTYIRTEFATEWRFLVLKSTGKHLNAVMSFLEWFGEYGKRLIKKQDLTLNQQKELLVFQVLEETAGCDESRLEMMKLSNLVKAKLSSAVLKARQVKELLADLLPISINKNQGNVKAIAANYPKCNSNGATPS
jgi:hypothetical protein